MLKINPLIDLFFTDLPFPERVGKIAECGYRYVETWQGENGELLKEVAEAGQACGVELISIVMNGPSNMTTAPVDRTKHAAFLEQIDRYSDNALAAGCSSGIVTTGNVLDEVPLDDQKTALIDALGKAGTAMQAKGFRLNLEPLNTLVDHAGYFLEDRNVGVEIVKAVGLENVRLLYDIYHMDIMTGNQTVFIRENIEWIGHFHSAGIPGRHELFNGETNYPFMVRMIEETGYKGFFGLEYMPELESMESLKKTLEYLTVS